MPVAPSQKRMVKTMSKAKTQLQKDLVTLRECLDETPIWDKYDKALNRVLEAAEFAERVQGALQ